MTTPRIPDGFCPIVSSYSFGGPGGVMRTDVAGGAARYALTWDRGTQNFNVTLILSLDHFSVWNAFYHHVIKKGAITFEMDIDSGFGLQAHSCNIVPDSYTATLTAGTHMSVVFVVEAESRAYDLTVQEAQDMVDVHNATSGQARSIYDRLAIFANQDANVLNF